MVKEGKCKFIHVANSGRLSMGSTHVCTKGNESLHDGSDCREDTNFELHLKNSTRWIVSN